MVDNNNCADAFSSRRLHSKSACAVDHSVFSHGFKSPPSLNDYSSFILLHFLQRLLGPVCVMICTKLLPKPLEVSEWTTYFEAGTSVICLSTHCSCFIPCSSSVTALIRKTINLIIVIKYPGWKIGSGHQ